MSGGGRWDPPMLEGEPAVRSVDEAETARRWGDAYQRILDFERRILAEMLELRDRAEPRTQPMIDASNISPMKDLVDAFEERHREWTKRAAELGGSGGGGQEGAPS